MLPANWQGRIHVQPEKGREISYKYRCNYVNFQKKIENMFINENKQEFTPMHINENKQEFLYFKMPKLSLLSEKEN
jgi:hypothetical protein